jgi:hypothetical protein
MEITEGDEVLALQYEEKEARQGFVDALRNTNYLHKSDFADGDDLLSAIEDKLAFEPLFEELYERLKSEDFDKDDLRKSFQDIMYDYCGSKYLRYLIYSLYAQYHPSLEILCKTGESESERLLRAEHLEIGEKPGEYRTIPVPEIPGYKCVSDSGTARTVIVSGQYKTAEFKYAPIARLAVRHEMLDGNVILPYQEDEYDTVTAGAVSVAVLNREDIRATGAAINDVEAEITGGEVHFMALPLVDYRQTNRLVIFYEPVSESVPDPKPEPEPDPDPAPRPEPDPDPGPAPGPGPGPNPVPDSQPEPPPESEPDTEPEPVLEPEPEPEPESESQPFSPANPGAVLLPNGQGSFLEIGEDGVPLGEWRYDPESGEWIYAPYAGLPQTGARLAETGGFSAWKALAMIALLGAVVPFALRRREDN